MIEWEFARQIARVAAATGAVTDLPAAPVAHLDEHNRLARRAVGRLTGLKPLHPLPKLEALDRREWADVNVTAFSQLLAPVDERLAGRIGQTIGPVAGPARMIVGLALAAEVGLLTGYLSQRVLGQYELALLEPETRPRLFVVAPNVEQAARRMRVDHDAFLLWVVLHEVTHAFQFSGVPWLREHLGGLVREYLDTVEFEFGPRARGVPPLLDPAKLVAAFREGGIASLVQTAEQRAIMEHVQATMAVIEGYAEHVMDVLGAEHVPGHAELRARMEARRRGRSTPERLLMRLLGFDLKLRQYALGRGFCAAVADRIGIKGLNRVWTSPDALPSLPELRAPERWIARVQAAEPSGA